MNGVGSPYRSRNFSAISICTTLPSCTTSRIVPNCSRSRMSATLSKSSRSSGDSSANFSSDGSPGTRGARSGGSAAVIRPSSRRHQPPPGPDPAVQEGEREIDGHADQEHHDHQRQDGGGVEVAPRLRERVAQTDPSPDDDVGGEGGSPPE